MFERKREEGFPKNKDRAISDPAFALHFVNGYFFYFNLV
jgi:hypothetical protein